MAAIRSTPSACLIALASLLLPEVARAAPPPAPAPRLQVVDAASSCPLIEGRFVALLRADRGMLLLSAARFEGGSRLGVATGTNLRVVPPASAAWTIERIGRPGSRMTVFGAAYPFRETPTTGCVAFDKEPFGSEGDLVTYVQWLVGDVYAKLPATERDRFPAFLLDDREVRLRLEHPGQGPIELHGGEGSSLAFSLADDERTFVLVPFVLDAPSGAVAIRLLAAEGSMWQTAPKSDLGWAVGSTVERASFTAPALIITVEGVSSTASLVKSPG